jgi:hypothetical protein
MDNTNLLITDNENLNEELINENQTNEIVDYSENANKNDIYETIINLLGLNIKINYPLKNITDGLIEMHMINNQKGSYSKYSKSLIFRNDPVSMKIKNILFVNNIPNFSYRVIQHRLLRAYRHYKYDKIMNINEPKKESKMEVLGFSNDNPRWSPLESLYL